MSSEPLRSQIEAEDLERLYAALGRGVRYLQYVEDVLITIKHEVKTPGRMPESEAKSHLAKHRRNTLGSSLKLVRTENLVSMDLMQALDRFKEERDWLVHRSQHSFGDRLYREVGRAEIFLRLDALTQEARRIQKAVLQEVNTFIASAGIDIEATEDIARKNLGRLRSMP